MNPALTNLTVPAETMIGTALILLGVAVKVMRNLSKRLSQSRLTLETDSFALIMQTQQDLSPQESPPLELDLSGGNDNGRSENEHGGIPPTSQRPKW